MAKTTWQTYTDQTPISTFRADFVRRGALCAALATRHPSLGAIAAESKGIVAAIDSRRDTMQEADDAQIIANAIEDAEKLDVVDVYTDMRRTMFAKKYDVMKIVPDAPSALGRLGADSAIKRTELALSNLTVLAVDDPIRVEFAPLLQKELAELQTADKTEDNALAALKACRLALTLYKSELTQVRESQLGTILTILKDREKAALCTMPWRKPSSTKNDDTPAEPVETT